MDRYVIQFAKKVGDNSFNLVYFNTYNDREEWQKCIKALMDTFVQVCGINCVFVSYHINGEFKTAYIEY
ncbi:MAG: hypothetical protein J6S85_23045 [Methanobrevibacter sp.]|nr:hypothetical protein [Methanobrevibacter sp.]